MSIEPGRYRATIEDYAIKTVGEKNTPQMIVKFKTKENGLAVYFTNFLTEGTTKSDYFKTLMDTLVETGTLRSKKFTDIAKGVKGGALATDVELEIIVDYERDQNNDIQRDSNGNPYTKVNFINNPNRSGVKGQLAESEAITVLSGLNLDAHILESEQRTKATVGNSAHTDPAKDDIPF